MFYFIYLICAICHPSHCQVTLYNMTFCIYWTSLAEEESCDPWISDTWLLKTDYNTFFFQFWGGNKLKLKVLSLKQTLKTL